MKKIVGTLIIAILLITIVGCSTHIHTIGQGAQSDDVQSVRQWYVLFGLIPINEVNTSEMVGDATDYEITTEATFTDVVITAFTQYVSVNCRTVTVKK